MPGFISGGPLARDLIRIGDDAIAREDAAALRDLTKLGVTTTESARGGVSP
jgi:hypothetical protein